MGKEKQGKEKRLNSITKNSTKEKRINSTTKKIKNLKRRQQDV